MRTERKLVCLKTWFTISLWILWVISAAVCGLLLWLRLDFWTNGYVIVSPTFNHYLILIYMSLVLSAVITVFSICGLIGGCLKVKWMLAMYLMTLVLTAFLTVAAVVYGTIYRVELHNTLLGNSFLKKIINSTYQDDSTHRITRAVNFVQSRLRCCGADSPSDYNQSSWHDFTLNAAANQTDYVGLAPVPASCCKDFFYQQNNPHTCYIAEKNATTDLDIWETGCTEKLQQFLNKYIVAIIGIPAAFFILQVLSIIICSAYICILNSLYVPQPDDLVYDMAHNQEKSPYPSRGDYTEYYK
ncbi:unnamed protein product [Candidula unifasciata]|uniref:Tetraspanin n=1 Tax=Candidula unifasciata TaxID=100452 RepID=A0A8S3YN59_9EUPU|nr:unnamed protein product [Candidula unifasciata]